MVGYGIKKLTVPLPFWNDNVHCYLGKNQKDKWVIVDTGLNTEKTNKSWVEQFKLLSINPSTDIDQILITHHHPDHFGFAYKLQKWTKAPIYIHNEELKVSSQTLSKIEKEKFYTEIGVPSQLISEFNNLNANSKENFTDIRLIKEGDTFTIGELDYKAIIMPGHSIKHVCFYNEKEGILFTGDHLTREVIPYISYQGIGEKNPLKSYINTLIKMREMNIETVLPGHGPIFTDVNERIEEVLEYYDNLLTNILNMENKFTAFDVMIKLNPKTNTSFEKWVGIGEVNALLNYLTEKFLVKPYKDSGKILYYKL